jgi:methyltransferase small domain protein
VSNPPYFEETLLSPNQQRAQARHVHHGLTFEALTQRSAQLLKSGGWLQVIIPKTTQSRFVRCAQDAGFSLIHQTDVHTVARKAPKRVMLRFQLHFTPPTQHENGHTIIGDFLQTNQLILQENGERSPQYQQLCADFYLTQGQLDARASKDEES